MKDRALRRHQESIAKKRSQQTYNSCIGDELTEAEKLELENNVEKLKKVCIATHLDEANQKASKKPIREMKHDISMKEQLKQPI